VSGKETLAMEKEAQAQEPDQQDPEQQELAARYQKHRQNHRYGFKQVEGRVVGRDKVVIPEEDVFKLAAMGCKETEIAEWFGISDSTLRFNFSDILAKGRLTLNQSLRRKQIDVALSGNATMLIFLGKNLLGQSDNPIAAGDLQPLPWSDE
jgi:DNA-binding NarL/FixJ family response regulator